MRRGRMGWIMCALGLALLVPAPAGAASTAAPGSAPLATWQAHGRVSALAISNGTVYLGGAFTSLMSHGSRSTLTRNHLAAIHESTGRPTAWNPNVNGNVQSIKVIGSRVYVGGSFTSIGGTAVQNLAALSVSTGRVVAGFGARVSGEVDALAASSTTLYLGGTFTAVDGASRRNLGAVSLASGALDTLWKPTADDTVHTLVDSPSLGRVYAGGHFRTVDGVSRPYLAALGQNRAVLEPWASRPLGQVWALALSPAGPLYAGVGGHEGGQLDSFHPLTGGLRWHRFADGDVQAIAIAGNEVLAGGHFINACATNKGGGSPWVCAQPVSRSRFFATTTAGALLGWNPDGNSLYGVWALRTDARRVVAGGDFTLVHGVHQARYAEFKR